MPSSTKHTLSITVLILLCLSAPALAQSTPAADGPAQEPTVVELDVVQVQGAEYDARRDDTASRIVVSAEELLRYGDTSLSEALKRLPGITVGIGPPGSSGAVSLRGLGSGYTQVLLNGQTPPSGFSIDTLPPELVERIEIIRSATADIRTEGIAGTINIVLASSARTNSRNLTASIANAEGKWTPSLNWFQSRREENRRYTLNTGISRREFIVDEIGVETGQDADGSTNFLRTTALRSEGRRDVASLAPNLNFALNNSGSLSFQGLLEVVSYERTTDINWDTLDGPELRHARYQQSFDFDLVTLRGDVSWAHNFENASRLETKLVLSGNHENNEFREAGFSAEGIQNLADETDGRLRIHGINSTGKYSLPATGDHRLVTGWEGSISRRRENRVQRLLPLGSEPDSFSDLLFDAQIQRFALYGQDEWTLTLNWSMYLGIRWEHIETISKGGDFAEVRNSARVASPVLQSLWKLPGERNDQVRFALSRTYRSPALLQLTPRPYTSTNNRPLSPDRQGNPDLRPELATGLDVSYERNWESGAQVSVGGYWREIEDVVRTETRFINGRWAASPVNGGDATARGLEMDTTFPLSQLFSNGPKVEVRFNATRNWSSVDDVPGPNNRLSDQPKFSSTLGADYVRSPAWTFGSSYTYVSGSPIRRTPLEIFSESSRREVDLYALWTWSADAKLRVSASNVLQQDCAATPGIDNRDNPKKSGINWDESQR